MPETAQNKDVNFILSYFNECFNTSLPNQPLSELINIYPLSKWSGGLKRISICFVYRTFPYLKFEVNASLGQIPGASLTFAFHEDV